MKRIDAIKEIMADVTEEVVISSTGMISRELYEVKDRDRNFYVMGSMGASLAIGLGLAWARPDLQIIVITGDGDSLMSLGTFALHEWINPSNLIHYILDNGCYASTGGQPTCSECINFDTLSPNTYVYKVESEKGESKRILLTPKQIKDRFQNSIGGTTVYSEKG